MTLANYLVFSLCLFIVRRQEFQTVLLSEPADMSELRINAVVDELLDGVQPDRIAFEVQQRAVEDERFESKPPQVDCDDDLVVAPEIILLQHRSLNSKY